MPRGKRKTIKHCVECGVEIKGAKDYCEPCHTRILERLRKKRGKKSLKPNNPT
jgi:hypothetical protein